jgi:PAS domain S-box-containing protein
MVKNFFALDLADDTLRSFMLEVGRRFHFAPRGVHAEVEDANMQTMHAELKRLSIWPCRLCNFVLVLVACLYSVFSTQVQAATTTELLIDQAELISLAGRRSVQLPHVLEPQDYLPKGSRVRYRMTVPLAQVPVSSLGIFVPKISISGTLYINGQYVTSCDLGRLEDLRCLHKPNLFNTPASAWQVGDNMIEFEVYANSRQPNGLSAVRVGSLDDLYESSYRFRHWIKIEFLVGFAWISAVFGFLSLAVSLILRKESAYLWFGLACLSHSLSLLTLTVSRPLIHVELFTWMVFTARLVATPMAVLTMLALFEKLRKWMIVALVGYAVSGLLVVGLSGTYRPIIVAFFLPVLIAAIILLVVSIGWALQSRNPLKIMTIGMALMLLLSGSVDWLRLSGRGHFEGVFLFPYTYSAMLITLGTLLFRNLATSLKRSREDRDQLERRANERMAYEVTEHIPVGTYTLIQRPGGMRGQFLFVSQRFLDLTGLDRKSVLTDPATFLNILHVDDWREWHQFIVRTAESHEKFSGQFRIFPPGGEMRWISTEAVPRSLPDGATLYEGVLVDQTDMIHAKEESERAHRELQKQQIEQSRMIEREQLLRDMHDGFGSQLAGVRMMAEKGRIPPEQFPQFLREITADLHLVVDTLGQLHITLEEALIDMHHRLERRFSGSGPKLHWKTQLHDLPLLPPRKILQALRLVQEALNNAFKHAHANNVWFLAQYDANHDVLTLSIRDDGQGLLLPVARGRGLNNMQYRAREIGGEFQLLQSQPGVEVVLRVPQISGLVRTDQSSL